jgi:nucleoside-diphosphate-sugar epimerase
VESVRVALLGATSHIAKGLIASLHPREGYELLLYGRSPERIREFLTNIEAYTPAIFSLDEFGVHTFDVVINCIGIGDPGKLARETATIFPLTEFWDNRILECLARRPEALYINFSSGAAYGGDFSRPVDDTTRADFPLNLLTPADYYGIAKLHSEAKHRAASEFNIVDLRVFSYFSRYMDLSTRFLLTDVAFSLKTGNELKTSSNDIVRDYVHPDDLASLVALCIGCRRLNGFYDVYSLKPVGKFEMLKAFAERFGLKFCVDEIEAVTATGNKVNYYSQNHRATALGYRPTHTSLESLCLEMTSLLACV